MGTAVTELLYISFPVQILTRDSYFVRRFLWLFFASGKYRLQLFHNCSLLHPCNSTIYCPTNKADKGDTVLQNKRRNHLTELGF